MSNFENISSRALVIRRERPSVIARFQPVAIAAAAGLFVYYGALPVIASLSKLNFAEWDRKPAVERATPPDSEVPSVIKPPCVTAPEAPVSQVNGRPVSVPYDTTFRRPEIARAPAVAVAPSKLRIVERSRAAERSRSVAPWMRIARPKHARPETVVVENDVAPVRFVEPMRGVPLPLPLRIFFTDLFGLHHH